MRILLPPSEGKTAPETGPGLRLDALSFPALTSTRARVLSALVELCRGDAQQSLSALGIGPSLAGEVQRNASLPDAPCAPAWQVYTGVLFAALDPATLPVGPSPLLIATALFGLVSASDPIPAYRLSGSVTLPGLPTPKKLWGPGLRAVLAEVAEEHLVVDMRSQTYAAWGVPAGAATLRVMTMRNGRRVTVSHHNKATKGLLARGLVTSGEHPRHGAELVDLLRSLGWDASPGAPGVVEVLH